MKTNYLRETPEDRASLIETPENRVSMSEPPEAGRGKVETPEKPVFRDKGEDGW
jgi:hypothetical protein